MDFWSQSHQTLTSHGALGSTMYFSEKCQQQPLIPFLIFQGR